MTFPGVHIGGHGNWGNCNAECQPKVMKLVKPTGTLDPICGLSRKIGPCRASSKRFFYNKESGECESFLYGGCEANANNFKKKETCETRCKLQSKYTIEKVVEKPSAVITIITDLKIL